MIWVKRKFSDTGSYFLTKKIYSIWTHQIFKNLLFIAEGISSCMQSIVLYLLIQIWVQTHMLSRIVCNILFSAIILTYCPNSF
jgi:hypothetical protein